MFNRRNFNICFVVLAYLAVSSINTAVADTHYVSSGQSIQAAVDESVNSDEIEVAPGTYNEAINFNGKAVRLYSTGGQDVTTIDATGIDASVVTCSNGEGSGTILEGFTITGGSGTIQWFGTTGGGMCNIGSSPTVINCTFTGNQAKSGGGMSNDLCSTTVTNCTFFDNTAVAGGGMYNGGADVAVTNCLFSGNSADWGGGMWNFSASPTVTNCTFSNNAGTFAGIYNECDSHPTVANCILWGNLGVQIRNGSYNPSDPPSTASVTYSDVQNGTGESWFGTGCIDTDPMFADADGRLSPASPCIDVGDTSVVVVTTDLDGSPRVQGLCVDMGAFEVVVDPEIMLDMLALFIAVEVDGGNIDPEIETSLLAKVNAAISALERGNPNDAKVAMNDLKALVNQVEAQSDNKITVETATAIIEMANQIITVIGG